MRRIPSLIARVGLVGLFLSLPACDNPQPEPPRLDHMLKEAKNPKEQIQLLQQAQKQYGPKENTK
jgi:hypothetical protein